MISSRWLLREPNPSGGHQVLTRHHLELSHGKQQTPRWRTRLDFRGSYGQDDYTTIRDTLAASTVGSPSGTGTAQTSPGGTTSGTSQQTTAAPVAISMMNIGANLGVGYRHSRIAETNFQLDTIYRDVLNTISPRQDASSRLIRQWASGASLSYSEAINRTLRIEASLRESYIHVAGQMETLVTQSTIGLGERINRDHAIAINVGATNVTSLRETSGQQFPGLLPTANFSWNGTLSNQRDRQIRASATSGYDWGFDPLTGVGSTRVPVNLRAECLLENRLGIAATLGYFTIISQSASSTGVTSLANGTMFTASLPITYRWNDRFTIESGVRMSLTGPRMAGPSELSGLELWGYAAIHATTRHRLE